MNFNNETKVKDIALANPEARQILEDARVDYCCGGGKSLHDACAHADVSAEDILKRLRENSKLVKPDEKAWTSAPLGDLTRHIREMHHRYVREAIGRIKTLLEKVKAKHGENHPEIAEVQRLFTEVGQEMIMHMQKEEQVLFPYIDAMEKASLGQGTVEPPFFRTVKNPVHTMMQEHDAAGDIVKQIRKASSEYAPPSDACPSFQTLYHDLQQFEADLHQHVHIENNILFPRAVDMEPKIL